MRIRCRTLKVLELLLTYPDNEFVGACAEMHDALRGEGLLSADTLSGLEKFFLHCRQTDLLDLQEDYVALFDRTPSLALHLFEHVHGDSRGRGQALADLDGRYREDGLHNHSEHTPDYLPLFLEYLSVLEAEKAREELGGAITLIAVLEERLRNRESPYAIVFSALRDIAARRPDISCMQEALERDPGRPMTSEEMDAAWEEQFAFADREDQTPKGCSHAAEDLKKTETRP